jgi:hypothetical protein
MMRRQHLGVRAFVAGYLLIQIAVPVYQLMKPGMTRFGWKMFARPARDSLYSVIEGGKIRRLGTPAQTGKVAIRRPEMEFDRYLPAHLCREMPTIEAVVVKPHIGLEQVTKCR